MGADGTGVANEAAGPTDMGTEPVMVVRASEFGVTNEEPDANRLRFSRISNGEG